MDKKEPLASEMLREIKRKNEVLCGAVALLLAAVITLVGVILKK